MKYEKLHKPLFCKRSGIINNGGVPMFWKNVLKNSELAGELIKPHDYDSLEYLEDISIITCEQCTNTIDENEVEGEKKIIRCFFYFIQVQRKSILL